jgi:hypothetical protein
VREDVEAGERLGRRDRLALGHEAHAGSQPQRLRGGGGVRQGDEGVVVVGEVRQHSTLGLLHQLARLRRRRDVGVVGENSDSKPRSSTARASSSGRIAKSAGKMAMPSFIASR